MLVHDVIAAMTSDPCLRVASLPFTVIVAEAPFLDSSILKPLKPNFALRHDLKSYCRSLTRTKSWGRLGPETAGSTSERLSSINSPE